MTGLIDLSGQTYGLWTVISRSGSGADGGSAWNCICACGTARRVMGRALRLGLSKECGHVRRVDLRGQVFGRLTAVEPLPGSKWLCTCDCGSQATVATSSLRNANSRSCGCLSVDRTREKFTKHGATRGRVQTAEYRAWKAMLWRCSPKNQSQKGVYYLRGIDVCAEWRENFPRFLEAVGPKPSAKHSIDRINNDLGYQPGNVRWATRSTQNNNKRSNIIVTFRGETMTAAQAREAAGNIVVHRVVRGRLRLGWTIEDAVTIPAGGYGKRPKGSRSF